ncbi:hypothetical protein HK098_003762 [Nowakowskiella sp. JEL0407]|nr:hypothetical protein HK098_003762 [Nowakowskiella sp. JEL0407]
MNFNNSKINQLFHAEQYFYPNFFKETDFSRPLAVNPSHSIEIPPPSPAFSSISSLSQENSLGSYSPFPTSPIPPLFLDNFSQIHDLSIPNHVLNFNSISPSSTSVPAIQITSAEPNSDFEFQQLLERQLSCPNSFGLRRESNPSHFIDFGSSQSDKNLSENMPGSLTPQFDDMPTFNDNSAKFDEHYSILNPQSVFLDGFIEQLRNEISCAYDPEPSSLFATGHTFSRRNSESSLSSLLDNMNLSTSSNPSMEHLNVNESLTVSSDSESSLGNEWMISNKNRRFSGSRSPSRSRNSSPRQEGTETQYYCSYAQRGLCSHTGSFSRRYNWKMHMSVHDNDRKKTHACVCGKRYYRNNELKRHLRLCKVVHEDGGLIR